MKIIYLPETGELPLDVAGGEASLAGDGVRDRAGVGLGSRKKLKSCNVTKSALWH